MSPETDGMGGLESGSAPLSTRRTLRGLLFRLTAGTLLPVLLFAATASWFSGQREQEIFEEGVNQRAHSILTAIETELKGSVTSLEALATSKALDTGDLDAFREEAFRVELSQRDWFAVSLALPDGRGVLSSLDAREGNARPVSGPVSEPVSGPVSGPVSEPLSLTSAVRTRKPVIGPIGIGGLVNRYNIPVRLPVIRNGEVRYVLTASVNPRSIQDLLLRQDFPRTWTSGVLDQAGHLVARTADYEKFLGQTGGAALLNAVQNSPRGIFHGFNLGNEEVYAPFVRSPTIGWVVVIGVPAATMEASGRRAIALIAIGALLAIALAMVTAHFLARRIEQPIGDLAVAARSLVEGIRPQPARLPNVREFIDLGEAFEEAGKALFARDEAQRRLAAVANNATVAIFMTNMRGECKFMNPAAEKMIGASFADVKGQPLRQFLVGRGADFRSGDISALEWVLRRGEAKAGEALFVNREGMAFPVAFACGPIMGQEGITGFMIEARDITQARQLEQVRLESLQIQTRAREEAEAANHAKDELLAMLGHELRNPLSAISNASTLLERPLPERQQHTAKQIIGRQVKHMTRLVDDLLDVARVTSGKIELSLAPVDLASLIQGAMEALTVAGKTEGHLISLDLRESWIEGDSVRLEQIVSNLLTNAFRYTPPAGKIDITLRHEGGSAVLGIADNGIGISAAVLPRIFDLFFQGEHAIDRKLGGLGIGLTLVRRLVDLHGGNVSVDSGGTGMGSTFTVTLPLLPEPPGEVPNHAVRGNATKKRILLVEDNIDSREPMSVILRAEGHEIAEADDGPGGLAMARQFRPDVAVIDIGLPGMSGLEIAAALRADPGGHKPFLIALTGYGQPEDAERALEAGFDLHLKKPVEMDRLLALIAGITYR